MAVSSATPAIAGSLNKTENLVMKAIGEEEEHLDMIIRSTGLTSSIVSSTLLTLELKKRIKQLPGKRFLRY